MRVEGFDFRAEARESQLTADNLQPFNLMKEQVMEEQIHSRIYSAFFFF